MSHPARKPIQHPGESPVELPVAALLSIATATPCVNDQVIYSSGMVDEGLITWEPAAGDAASLDAPGERLGSGKWDENTWCPPMATPAVPPDPNDRVGYSPEIEAGRLDVDDVIRPIYQEASEALGRNFEYPKK